MTADIMMTTNIFSPIVNIETFGPGLTAASDGSKKTLKTTTVREQPLPKRGTPRNLIVQYKILFPLNRIYRGRYTIFKFEGNVCLENG